MSEDDRGLIYLADTINGIVWNTLKLRVALFMIYIALVAGFVWWTVL